jgi:pre-rRNA-processing protein TSR3
MLGKSDQGYKRMTYPPTIVIRHPRENPKKCSILPLQGRADLIFYTYPLRQPLPLDGYVRLAVDGPPLSRNDASQGILLLDASWRWADAMTKHFEEVPPRSLAGWKTAYPRVSKLGTDPDEGLATVEALFIAYHILDRPTAGLLNHYRWRAEFLQLNQVVESPLDKEVDASPT